MYDTIKLTRTKAVVTPETARSIATATLVGSTLGTYYPVTDAVGDTAIAQALNDYRDDETARPLLSSVEPPYSSHMDRFEQHWYANKPMYAADFWQYTYGEFSHATLVMTARGKESVRAMYENCCMFSVMFSTNLFITTSRLQAPKCVRTDDFETLLFDPHTCAPPRLRLQRWTEELDQVAQIETLRGPDLAAPVWDTPAPGEDINFDAAYPHGVVTGAFRLSRHTGRLRDQLW